MAYNTGTLSELGHVIGGRSRLWVYNSADALNAILASGYISDAGKKRMMLGDIVLVASGTLNTSISASPSLAGVGTAAEFSAVPTWQVCIVSAMSGLDSQNRPVATSAATLQPVGPSNVGQGNNFRNMLDGGDATINPMQRGASISNIGATNTYTADRFFMVGGAGSSSLLVQSAEVSVAGFTKAFKWGRGQSSGSVSTLVVGQVLESLDSVKAQGQPVTFSFWAKGDAGFSTGVSGSILGVQLSQGFGTDQSASALVNGTWTTQSDVISTTQALTSTMTRYSFSGVVSSTATQLGAQVKYTATNTTAQTAENVIMNGLQLEIGPLSPFEHRDVEVELALCQRYFFQINEPGTSGAVIAAGMVAGTNTCEFVINLPVQMRAAPTTTVTNGSFGALQNNAYTALTSMAAGASHTPNYVSVLGNATAVSNFAALLISSSATVGKIVVSADL